jgi:hypothetical protein
MKEATIGIIILAVLILLGWLFTVNDVAQQAYVQPQLASINRHTFEQSESYIKGTRDQIDKDQIEYLSADAASRPLIRTTILDQYGNIDESILTPNERTFLDQLRQDRLNSLQK